MVNLVALASINHARHMVKSLLVTRQGSDFNLPFGEPQNEESHEGFLRRKIYEVLGGRFYGLNPFGFFTEEDRNLSVYLGQLTEETISKVDNKVAMWVMRPEAYILDPLYLRVIRSLRERELL